MDDSIILAFADAKFRYVCNAARPGADHVDAMKRLALGGKGLTPWVNQHVREKYAAKIQMKARSYARGAALAALQHNSIETITVMHSRKRAQCTIL